MDEKSESLYIKALQEWGENAQVGMFIEEIGEVLVALNKVTRTTNGTSIENLVEELADLEIMLEQMKILFVVENVFEQAKLKKLKRLAERLDVSY